MKYFPYRFSNFREAPLKYFKVFDYALWPRDRDALASHGTEDLQGILSYFPDLFPAADHCTYLQEFQSLKALLIRRNPKDMKQVFYIKNVQTYHTFHIK